MTKFVWLLLLRESLDNIYIVIVCCPGFDIINFEKKHIFLVIPFLLHNQNVKAKNLDIFIMKRAFKMK